MSSIGKILVVDKTNGKVVHFLNDASDGVRPPVENLTLIELEYGQYSDEFSRLKDGINSISVTDIENKVLKFELNPLIVTPQDQITELQNELLLQTNKEVGGIL